MQVRPLGTPLLDRVLQYLRGGSRSGGSLDTLQKSLPVFLDESTDKGGGGQRKSEHVG